MGVKLLKTLIHPNFHSKVVEFSSTEHKDKGYLLNSTPVYMLDCRDQTGF